MLLSSGKSCPKPLSGRFLGNLDNICRGTRKQPARFGPNDPARASFSLAWRWWWAVAGAGRWTAPAAATWWWAIWTTGSARRSLLLERCIGLGVEESRDKGIRVGCHVIVRLTPLNRGIRICCPVYGGRVQWAVRSTRCRRAVKVTSESPRYLWAFQTPSTAGHHIRPGRQCQSGVLGVVADVRDGQV